MPAVLAAAACLASFIEAEQYALRARGCDATLATLERVGRWYGSASPSERDGPAQRATLIETVEQAMKDEVAAFAEVASDRRAVQAKATARRAATATKRLGQRIGIGVRCR